MVAFILGFLIGALAVGGAGYMLGVKRSQAIIEALKVDVAGLISRIENLHKSSGSNPK